MGFVLTEGDPYALVDLDGCRDPLTGALDGWAMRIVAASARRSNPDRPTATGAVCATGYARPAPCPAFR